MKQYTRQDIFNKIMEVLEVLTYASIQGNFNNPKVLFLLNETIGEVMDNPELAKEIEKMISAVLSGKIDAKELLDKISDPPVASVDKKTLN